MIEVTAAIICKEGKVFLAKRKRGKHLGGFWELPGGKIEAGESPIICLKRELMEELGILSTIGNHFSDSEYSYNHLSIRLKAYFIEGFTGKLEPREHDDIKWVMIDQLHTYKLAPADIPIIKELQSKFANPML